MKMKNCDLTLTTPAVCFVTFGCICWLLGEKEEGWGGRDVTSLMKGGYLT